MLMVRFSIQVRAEHRTETGKEELRIGARAGDDLHRIVQK
jgi:hypothetical protein